MSLESYEMVILRRPAQPAQLDDDTLERLQIEHMDYHAGLRAQGIIVTNGPVREQPDESLRGFTVYRTGSTAETRRLAEADPLVKAGRLVVDVMHWLCPTGTMVQSGQPWR